MLAGRDIAAMIRMATRWTRRDQGTRFKSQEGKPGGLLQS